MTNPSPECLVELALDDHLGEGANEVREAPDPAQNDECRHDPALTRQGPNLGVANRGEGDDEHVETFDEVPAQEEHVSRDSGSDDESQEKEPHQQRPRDRMLRPHPDAERERFLEHAHAVLPKTLPSDC
jgi:hypothetical protein